MSSAKLALSIAQEDYRSSIKVVSERLSQPRCRCRASKGHASVTTYQHAKPKRTEERDKAVITEVL